MLEALLRNKPELIKKKLESMGWSQEWIDKGENNAVDRIQELVNSGYSLEEAFNIVRQGTASSNAAPLPTA